jgi:hypothetical protein
MYEFHFRSYLAQNFICMHPVTNIFAVKFDNAADHSVHLRASRYITVDISNIMAFGACRHRIT